VPNELSTVPWIYIGEWRYSSIILDLGTKGGPVVSLTHLAFYSNPFGVVHYEFFFFFLFLFSYSSFFFSSWHRWSSLFRSHLLIPSSSVPAFLGFGPQNRFRYFPCHSAPMALPVCLHSSALACYNICTLLTGSCSGLLSHFSRNHFKVEKLAVVPLYTIPIVSFLD
jgi:hypothetical protein